VARNAQISNAVYFNGTANYFNFTNGAIYTNGNLTANGNIVVNGTITAYNGISSTNGTFNSIHINPITLDVSGLDQATWYPVTINIPNSRRTRMRIMVALDSGTVPNWSTHPSGFSVLCDWTSNGSGWGTIPVTRTIHTYAYGWANVSPIGGISQMSNTSNEVVYLRGGGKYFFEADYAVTPIVHSTSYTTSSETVSPSTSLINDVFSSASAPVAFGDLSANKGTFSDLLTANNGLTVNGNIQATGEVTAYTTSDKRLKKNIKTIDNALDIINKIRPVSFNWNDKAKELNSSKTDTIEFGMIAQELEKILPNTVKNMYDGKYKGINYIQIIPYLIAAIQELTEEINILKNKYIKK
jgi:hypothetical protein